MTKDHQPKEVLRLSHAEHDCGDMEKICNLLREHKVAFSRPGPHWFPTILAPYEMIEDGETGDFIIRK
jgi:hypothetical protein